MDWRCWRLVPNTANGIAQASHLQCTVARHLTNLLTLVCYPYLNSDALSKLNDKIQIYSTFTCNFVILLLSSSLYYWRLWRSVHTMCQQPKKRDLVLRNIRLSLTKRYLKSDANCSGGVSTPAATYHLPCGTCYIIDTSLTSRHPMRRRTVLAFWTNKLQWLHSRNIFKRWCSSHYGLDSRLVVRGKPSFRCSFYISNFLHG